MNRLIAPVTHKIGAISFITPEKITLKEHAPLYWMPKVPNKTTRIDLYFDAGLRQSKNSIVSMTSSMILSGTAEKSSTEIHSQLDDLGAFFDIGLSHEGVMISLFALKENVLEAFEVLIDAIQNASFPEDELQEMKAEKIQNFKININRVSTMAQRAFQQKIFHNTDYAELSEEADLHSIQRKELQEFHQKHYQKGLSKIAIVGALTEVQVNKISDLSKPYCISQSLQFESKFCNQPGHLHLEKEDAVQTAIRIGKTLFNKTHSDFLDMSILSTILGDYFGSRLMKNIREDKGYTYGIGTAIAETGGSGYFLIGSEVGKEHLSATLAEIEKELLLLQNEKVSQDELHLVKNHLFGQILKMSDGPYAMMDLYLSVESYGFETDFYNSYIQRIHDINENDLLKIANSHLHWNEMSIISAG
ncbi:MAG: pitrilysin family protein [Crocinitomicaceae bacterium]|jgi:predicted Zn-dependent peptidase|tara:strand:+ start:9647 stop:10900 length:1254 start_codon:yes stop_codon:yes gene_type:complete